MKESIRFSWKNILIVLCLIIAYVSLITLFQYFHESAGLYLLGIFSFSYPTVMSELHTVLSINNFSGSEMEMTKYWIMNFSFIAGLIFTLIIVPFVYIKGNMKEKKEGGNPSYSWSWYAGTALMIMALVIVNAKVLLNVYKYSSEREMVERSAQTDKARKILLESSLKAAELMILPEEYGGGSGSFLNLVGKDGKILPEARKQIVSSENDLFDITIGKKIQDSVLILRLTGPLEGVKNNYQNANGKTGMFELVAEVTPMRENIISFKNSMENSARMISGNSETDF